MRKERLVDPVPSECALRRLPRESTPNNTLCGPVPWKRLRRRLRDRRLFKETKRGESRSCAGTSALSAPHRALSRCAIQSVRCWGCGARTAGGGGRRVATPAQRFYECPPPAALGRVARDCMLCRPYRRIASVGSSPDGVCVVLRGVPPRSVASLASAHSAASEDPSRAMQGTACAYRPLAARESADHACFRIHDPYNVVSMCEDPFWGGVEPCGPEVAARARKFP